MRPAGFICKRWALARKVPVVGSASFAVTTHKSPHQWDYNFAGTLRESSLRGWFLQNTKSPTLKGSRILPLLFIWAVTWWLRNALRRSSARNLRMPVLVQLSGSSSPIPDWWRRGDSAQKGNITWKGVARVDSCLAYQPLSAWYCILC
jgi:hypothetical protein